VIKRVSTAVGLQELSGTYADVLQDLGPAIPGKLIDVSIRLDHFDSIPLAQIEKHKVRGDKPQALASLTAARAVLEKLYQ